MIVLLQHASCWDDPGMAVNGSRVVCAVEPINGHSKRSTKTLKGEMEVPCMMHCNKPIQWSDNKPSPSDFFDFLSPQELLTFRCSSFLLGHLPSLTQHNGPRHGCSTVPANPTFVRGMGLEVSIPSQSSPLPPNRILRKGHER